MMPSKRCPNCGAMIPQEATFCMNCGARVDGASSQQHQPQQQWAPQSQAQPQYQPPSQYQRPQPGQQWSQQSASPASNSFLAQWKTSGGAVFGGVAVLYVLLGLLSAGLSISMPDAPLAIIVYIVEFILIIARTYYAGSVFPSLFGPSPKAQSNGSVSFMNGFFCGVIFGPIFCSNLTHGKKGAANVVFIVLQVLLIISLIGNIMQAFGVATV